MVSELVKTWILETSAHINIERAQSCKNIKLQGTLSTMSSIKLKKQKRDNSVVLSKFLYIIRIVTNTNFQQSQAQHQESKNANTNQATLFISYASKPLKIKKKAKTKLEKS